MNANPQNGDANPFAADPTSFAPTPVPGTQAAGQDKKTAPKVSLRRSAEPQPEAKQATAADKPKDGKLGKPGSRLRIPSMSDFWTGTLVTLGLYAAIVGTPAYAFMSGTWHNISMIPTVRASLSVSKDNLAKQKQEKSYLDSLSVDDKDLSRKESELASYFPKDSPKLRLSQAAAIDQLAQDSGISIAGFQKIDEEADQWKKDKLAESLKSAGIPDFSEDLWYAKYNLEITGSEDAIMRFMEEAERIPAVSVESFSITRSASDVRYSVVLKYHYIVPVTE